MVKSASTAVPARVVGAVFLAAGVFLLICSAGAALLTSDFLARSLVAPGVVTDERFGSHHVEVRFRTSAGEDITYAQNGMVTLHKGELVNVRYDPAEPRAGPCVDQWLALWDVTLFLALMGGAFAIVGGRQVMRRDRA